MTQESFNSAQFPAIANFESLRSYYFALKRLETEHIGSSVDSERDVREALSSLGFTRAQLNQEMSFLNSIGNNIFNYGVGVEGANVAIFYMERISPPDATQNIRPNFEF